MFPHGLTSRGATLTDAAAVVELINRAEQADMGEAMLELSDIETEWAFERFDTARDVLLVEEGDRLVAWAQVIAERANADVDPKARNRGIGAALVGWTEHRALERAAAGEEVRIGQTVHENVPGIAEHLSQRGYEHLWASWVLRLPADAELERRGLPSGLEIRPYRTDEERAVYTIVEDAFNEFDGRTPNSLEDWQARTTLRPDFDPSLLLLATLDGEPVGVCLGLHYPGEGWIEQLAVKSTHRGRGIARAMLVHTYEEFRARGEQRLGLNTDSRTGALDLYLNLGMVVEHTFNRWSRELGRRDNWGQAPARS